MSNYFRGMPVLTKMDPFQAEIGGDQRLVS